VLENLLFANGKLWVSDGSANEIKQIDADHASGASVKNVASPGGLVLGIDGRIYAGTGDAVAGAVTRSKAATVISFDPRTPQTTETYATGLNMANGVTMAPNGDLYVSNDLDVGLYRIPRALPHTPVLLNDTWGTNGLVLLGSSLYSAITFDGRSPIEVSDVTTAAHHTAFRLSASVVSLQPNVYPDGADPSKPLVGLKGLDDMTTDGTYLYPVANGMGELLRVNVATGDACLIASGLQNPSSVRIAPENSGFADGKASTIDFYVTEFSGNIRHVVYAPA